MPESIEVQMYVFEKIKLSKSRVGTGLGMVREKNVFSKTTACTFNLLYLTFCIYLVKEILFFYQGKVSFSEVMIVL